jgi:hypothetical protein
MNEYLYVVSEIQSVYAGLTGAATADTMFSAVSFPCFKPCDRYVLLTPCTVVLYLLQTLVHFSPFGFLIYILFCLIILRFPSFIDLAQIVAC